MNKLRLLATVALIFGLLVLMLTVLDFLALTDIRRDYLSQGILEYLDITLPNKLPEWTGTRGEWQVVELSLYSRVGFLVLNSITLWLCIRRFKHHEDAAPQFRSHERDIP